MVSFMRSEKGTDLENPQPEGDTGNTQSSPPKPDGTARKASQNMEPSVISAALRVTGNLESDAEIQLHGSVVGDVRAKVVTIGEGANVSGAVYGETVNVAGTIEGEIEARTVVIEKTAHVTGDIIHESLKVEAGAYVNGHCRPEFGKKDKLATLPRQTVTAQNPEAKSVEKPADSTEKTRSGAI